MKASNCTAADSMAIPSARVYMRLRSVVQPIFTMLMFGALIWQVMVYQHVGAAYENGNIRATLWKDLINHTETGLIAVDADNESVLDWNPAAARLLGYTRSEALGQPLSFVMPSEHRAAHAAYITNDAVKERLLNEVLIRNCQLLGKDGKLVDVAIQVRGVQGYHYVYIVMVDPVEKVSGALETGLSLRQ